MLNDVERSILASAVMLWAATGTGRVEAAPVNVVNPGFEDDLLDIGDFAIQLHHTGWSATTNTFIVSGIAHPPLSGQPNGVDTIDTTPEGNQYGFSRNGVGLQQVLTEEFNPGLSYVLSLQAALSSETSLPSLGYRIEFGTLGTGFTPLAFMDFNEDAGTPRDDTFRDVGISWNPGDFQPPGTTGHPLYIRLTTDGSNGLTLIGAAFDDVRFESSAVMVPEPGAYCLFAIGGLMLLVIHRRSIWSSRLGQAN